MLPLMLRKRLNSSAWCYLVLIKPIMPIHAKHGHEVFFKTLPILPLISRAVTLSRGKSSGTVINFCPAKQKHLDWYCAATISLSELIRQQRKLEYIKTEIP
jgi:hypothetical protein